MLEKQDMFLLSNFYELLSAKENYSGSEEILEAKNLEIVYEIEELYETLTSTIRNFLGYEFLRKIGIN